MLLFFFAVCKELKLKLKYKPEIKIQAAAPSIIFINISLFSWFAAWRWRFAPFTETTVSLCSFICVRTEAQTWTRNSWTHTNKFQLVTKRTDGLVFVCISCLTLQINPPKSTDREAEFECCHAPPSPRKKWVVAAQPVPSEDHSSRVRASNFPGQHRRKPFPHTRLLSRVSWIKSAAATMAQDACWVWTGDVMLLEFRSFFFFFSFFLKRALTPKGDQDLKKKIQYLPLHTVHSCVRVKLFWGKHLGFYWGFGCAISKEWGDKHPVTCITAVACVEHVDKVKRWLTPIGIYLNTLVKWGHTGCQEQLVKQNGSVPAGYYG